MADLLAYLFYFVANTISPLQRRWLAVQREGGGQIDFAFKVMSVTSVFALSFTIFKSPELNGGWIKLLLLSLTTCIFGSVYFSSMYSAQRHVEAGISTLIVNVYVPITILLSTMLLNESLTFRQLIGAVLLFVAMLMVTKKHRIGKFRFDKYFWTLILSGVCLAVTLTAERALMKTTGFTAGVLLSWWSQVIGLGILVLLFKSKTTYNKRDTLITGSLRFFQASSWVILLFVVANLSLVSAVTTFKVVVVFIAAAIFLNEREDLLRKILGSLVAVAGLILMA